MFALLAARFKVILSRQLSRVGLRPEVGMIPIAGLIGVLTAMAAVTFHELIKLLVNVLFKDRGADWLYGPGLWLLVVAPAAGGLAVGLITRYLIRSHGGHGMVDVIESVLRTRGFVRPILAVEKILTSALTIGSGGSGGAEGPIVQIGAAISSGVGSMLAVPRHRMPLLVGCGTAAGISSIFHCPIGGVFFTLEVILRDFSVRTLAPVVVASVVANVATYSIFQHIEPNSYAAIFAVPKWDAKPEFSLTTLSVVQFVILGLVCGLVGVALTRMMLAGEHAFKRLDKLGPFRPALGGAMVGVMGVLYVLSFGWILKTEKPVPFSVFPMPAFFSDGYGVVRSMLDGSFGQHIPSIAIVIGLLACLLALKLVATTITLTSGGSGGVIAPALFLGAAAGQLMGAVMPLLGANPGHGPAFAIVGMGACLAAIVHAPLASMLILFELTVTPDVIVPSMLAVITAHGLARMVMNDSVYTLSLRQRGISPEAAQDMTSLRKYTIDHLKLQPIHPLRPADTARQAIEQCIENDETSFVVLDPTGSYMGMVTDDELRPVMADPETLPLVTIGDLMRTDIPPVRHTENLASLFDLFVRYNVDALPVGLEYNPKRTIGIVTRDVLMKHYQKHIDEN